MGRPIRVLHPITRMIVGGAQENTLLSCSIIDRERFPSTIVTGPQTGSEGELMSETRARGVPLVLEPSLVRELNPIKDLIATIQLYRLMKRERFDVVHTHTSKAGIVGRIAAKLAGVPVIIHTAHGWAFTEAQSKAAFTFYVWVERLCARWCDAIIVVAARDQEFALRNGVGRPEQYLLIRSGIEVEAFRNPPVSRAQMRATLGIPDAAHVVGFVGRLSDQKAPLDMVAAFARVAHARPDAHLVLVGDGPLRAEVEAAVAKAGLQSRVHLLGIRRDVPSLLAAFDVLALPSLWEGLPRVFPQAMAAGLPIVATRVAGAAEAIIPGDNGWLVDVGQVDAMAGRLIELAADPAAARRMGERGRERVDEFSAERMVRELERLYARLAAVRESVAA